MYGFLLEKQKFFEFDKNKNTYDFASQNQQASLIVPKSQSSKIRRVSEHDLT